MKTQSTIALKRYYNDKPKRRITAGIQSRVARPKFAFGKLSIHAFHYMQYFSEPLAMLNIEKCIVYNNKS